MGAIVSSQQSGHGRPASAQVPKLEQAGADRPTSAPPSLMLSAERTVDVARRREALSRVDDLRDECAQAQQPARFACAISPEQEMQLERMVGEALVDQVMYEGQGTFSSSLPCSPPKHPRVPLSRPFGTCPKAGGSGVLMHVRMLSGVLASLSGDDAATVLQDVQRGDGALSGMLRLQASSHGIDLTSTSTLSLSRPRSSMPSTSRSAASEDEEAERQRARDLKRVSAAEGRETRVRMQSGRSDASDQNERQLEEALVLSGVQEQESKEKHRMSADVLAHFARDRSRVMSRAKDALLEKLKTSGSTGHELQADTHHGPDQAPRQDLEQEELAAESSAPSPSSRQPPEEDLGGEQRTSSHHRGLLDPLTPAELEEADAMVADIMQEATDLMSQLPEQHLQGVLEEVNRGHSPVAQLFREHLALREHARMEDLAACEDGLDEILREGEALLQRLPDGDARALFQILDYTPRSDSEPNPHPHSSNNNAVVCALRAHARQVEDDALVEAEAMLASEGLIDSILDAAVVSDSVEALLEEGQALLDQLPDTAAKDVLEDLQRATSPVADLLRNKSASPDLILHTSLRLGGLVPYGGSGKEVQVGKEGEEEVQEPEVMNSGRAALMDMLEESDKLLGALPSPHARDLLHVLETSETLLSGAIRNPHAAAAAFEADVSARAVAAARGAHEDRAETAGVQGASCAGDAAEVIPAAVTMQGQLDERFAPEEEAADIEEKIPQPAQEAAGSAVVRDGVGRIQIEDGLTRLKLSPREGKWTPIALVVDAMGRPVLEDGLARRYLGDDGLSRRWLCGKVLWRNASVMVVEEAKVGAEEETRPSTVDSWAQTNAEQQHRATQHDLVSEDAETQVVTLRVLCPRIIRVFATRVSGVCLPFATCSNCQLNFVSSRRCHRGRLLLSLRGSGISSAQPKWRKL